MQWQQLVEWPEYLLQLISRHQTQLMHRIMVRLHSFNKNRARENFLQTHLIITQKHCHRNGQYGNDHSTIRHAMAINDLGHSPFCTKRVQLLNTCQRLFQTNIP